MLDAIDDLTLWPLHSYDLGLTDGLPVFPPLRDVVDCLIEGSGLAADHVVGAIAPRDGVATIEAIAANAAMAGALPAHMPIVVAAIDAMLADPFNLRGVLTTTHGCWPLVIVSGPVVAELDMASAESVFSGGGSHANVAIGRAVALTLWNLGGARPGAGVKEVFGHPGRLGFCIAESAASPWEPFHVSRGVDTASGVSVFACEAPHSAALWGAPQDPALRLDWPADALRTKGSNNTNTMGEALVCVSPSEARHLAAAGWTRADVQQRVYELAHRPRADLRPDGGSYPWWQGADSVAALTSPQHLHVVVTGGDSIPWYAVCPGWGDLGGYLQAKGIG